MLRAPGGTMLFRPDTGGSDVAASGSVSVTLLSDDGDDVNSVASVFGAVRTPQSDDASEVNSGDAYEAFVEKCDDFYREACAFHSKDGDCQYDDGDQHSGGRKKKHKWSSVKVTGNNKATDANMREHPTTTEFVSARLKLQEEQDQEEQDRNKMDRIQELTARYEREMARIRCEYAEPAAWDLLEEEPASPDQGEQGLRTRYMEKAARDLKGKTALYAKAYTQRKRKETTTSEDPEVLRPMSRTMPELLCRIDNSQPTKHIDPRKSAYNKNTTREPTESAQRFSQTSKVEAGKQTCNGNCWDPCSTCSPEQYLRQKGVTCTCDPWSDTSCELHPRIIAWGNNLDYLNKKSDGFGTSAAHTHVSTAAWDEPIWSFDDLGTIFHKHNPNGVASDAPKLGSDNDEYLQQRKLEQSSDGSLDSHSRVSTPVSSTSPSKPADQKACQGPNANVCQGCTWGCDSCCPVTEVQAPKPQCTCGLDGCLLCEGLPDDYSRDPSKSEYMEMASSDSCGTKTPLKSLEVSCASQPDLSVGSLEHARQVLRLERFSSVDHYTLQEHLGDSLGWGTHYSKALSAYVTISKHQNKTGCWDLHLHWNDSLDAQLRDYVCEGQLKGYCNLPFYLGTTMEDCEQRWEAIKPKETPSSVPKATNMASTATDRSESPTYPTGWNAELDEQLLDLKADGCTYGYIALRLNKPQSMCRSRFEQIKSKDCKRKSSKQAEDDASNKQHIEPQPSTAVIDIEALDGPKDNGSTGGWGVANDHAAGSADDDARSANQNGGWGDVSAVGFDTERNDCGCLVSDNSCCCFDAGWCDPPNVKMLDCGCHPDWCGCAAPPAYTVTYQATIVSGGKQIQVPIDGKHVSGPKKSIIDSGLQKVWEWVHDKGLDDKIGLQDAFELAQAMHEGKADERRGNGFEWGC